MDDAKLAAIVDAIVRELQASGAVKTNGSDSAGTATAAATLSAPSAVPVKPRTATSTADLNIDLPDPTLNEYRYKARVKNPKDANGVRALMDSTTARIGVGRAGPRYSTASLLLFQGDHAVTQDALYRDVDQKLLDQFNLFTVQTKITGGKRVLRPKAGVPDSPTCLVAGAAGMLGVATRLTVCPDSDRNATTANRTIHPGFWRKTRRNAPIPAMVFERSSASGSRAATPLHSGSALRL
jgi:hypothetical protein